MKPEVNGSRSVVLAALLLALQNCVKAPITELPTAIIRHAPRECPAAQPAPGTALSW